MPPRTWAPRDRLTDADLNAMFSLMAEGRMPGALCPSGSEVSVPNAATELPIGAPAEGADAGAYWQGGRLVIPRGFAGWHVASFLLAGMAGTVKGDQLRIVVRGIGGAQTVHLAARGTPVTLWTLTFADRVADLTTIWVEAATTAANAKAQLIGVNLVRLASHGAYK